jgi:hypothetical protein
MHKSKNRLDEYFDFNCMILLDLPLWSNDGLSTLL